jgi:hypothetical protein
MYFFVCIPSRDTKMHLKVVFDKTSFVKFKISNNFTQNIDETHAKQPKIHRKIHTSLWIIKISRKKSANQRSQDFCQNVCDFQKENHTLGYGFKNLWKIYNLPYGFLFFVISISVLAKNFHCCFCFIQLRKGQRRSCPNQGGSRAWSPRQMSGSPRWWTRL